MIKYYKLFDMINRRGMKKTDLLKVISSPTLAKLSKGETVQTNIIDRICLFMGCQPGDIMECIEDSTPISKDGYVSYTTKQCIPNTDETVEVIYTKRVAPIEKNELD